MFSIQDLQKIQTALASLQDEYNEAYPLIFKSKAKLSFYDYTLAKLLLANKQLETEIEQEKKNSELLQKQTTELRQAFDELVKQTAPNAVTKRWEHFKP